MYSGMEQVPCGASVLLLTAVAETVTQHDAHPQSRIMMTGSSAITFSLSDNGYKSGFDHMQSGFDLFFPVFARAFFFSFFFLLVVEVITKFKYSKSQKCLNQYFCLELSGKLIEPSVFFDWE